ncbi:ribokinase [Streptomyces monticola]|uniref:Ribokinase n=1 Tax=Streptomyces monticola TaxID=2666263 RepID=A0ABW2JV27_9ACTN
MGSLNMDLSVTVGRLPRPGETVSGTDVVRGAGGKGANQAVAAARLGARVRMVGLVGADAYGDELLDGLTAEGVDTAAVRQLPHAATGLALIVVQGGGENTITLSPGANHRLDPEVLGELSRTAPPGPSDTVLLQLEIPLPSVLAAARAARTAGARVVLNAAPLPRQPSVLADLLAYVDVLVVNESEAQGLLGGPPGPDGWLGHAGRLRGLGPGTVVITLGAAGAVAVDGTHRHTQPGFPVEALDAVGAGDAFCAELAHALGDGAALQAAVRRACAAGALATTRPGAQAALPTRAEVDALLTRVPPAKDPTDPRDRMEPKAPKSPEDTKNSAEEPHAS